MNVFAVNAAAVNGSNQLWSWYGDATVALQADGALAAGLILSGSATLEMQSSADAIVMVRPTLSAAIVALEADGTLSAGVVGSGQAEIAIGSDADGTRRTFGEGVSDVVLAADGDAQVVEPAASSMTIVLDSELDARIIPVTLVEGSSVIQLASGLDEHVAKAHQLASCDTFMELASIGYGYLVIDSPLGGSYVALESQGSERLGEIVPLDPLMAALELYTRCELEVRHYVYGEGDSTIAVDSTALAAGLPAIPPDYSEAPRSRQFHLSSERRVFIVPKDRDIYEPGGYLPIEAAADRIYRYANTQLPMDTVTPP